jgi:arylsulfatase A-like enzyme
VLTGIVSLEDMVPTMMAAGIPDIKEHLLNGHKAGEKYFRVRLDGYNQLPYLTGEADESSRREFFYYGEHDLFALRYNNWKVHFQVKDDWFADRRELQVGRADPPGGGDIHNGIHNGRTRNPARIMIQTGRDTTTRPAPVPHDSS